MGGLALCQQRGAVFGAGQLYLYLTGLGGFAELVKLSGCADYPALGLGGHGICNCTGGKGLNHRGVVGGLDIEIQAALLTVAYTVARVGGEAHVGVLLLAEIVGHILHAYLLCGAENNPELALAGNAGVLNGPQAVEGHYCRALIVGDAPAYGPAVFSQLHLKRVRGPALTGGNDIQVGHDNGVALPLPYLGMGGVVVHILGLQPVALSHLHGGVQGPGALVAEGVLPLRGHGNRWHGHHPAKVPDDIVPIVQYLLSKHFSFPLFQSRICQL